MIVVADSSPLNYLVLIDEIDVLPKLFGRVLIPEAVARELQSPRTPPQVASWLAAQPVWLVIQAPAQPISDQELERLGAAH
jgi:predicted nucleic acid-binding protein